MILWVEDATVTGWPTNINLVARVSAYTRSDRVWRYKIGLTNNPAMRAGQHSRDRAPYSRMIVLYRTQSRKHSAEMESLLIELYADHCDNVRKGGAGRYPETAWKYVYLLIGYKRPYGGN